MLKRIFKNLARRLLCIEPDTVSSVSQKCACVSFDMFDTLVLRNVRTPSDVFRIAYRNASGKLHGLSCEDFVGMRLSAEREARECSGGADTTLAEIYARMNLDLETAVEVALAEMEAEVAVCTPNRAMLSVYKRCIDEGKTVVITTDMYLPRLTLERMLEKCGAIGYHQLFISSEVGATKRLGGLFEVVERECRIDRGAILHVGDSLVSDYLRPKKMGFCAALIGEDSGTLHCLRNNARDESFDFSCMKRGVVNTLPHDENPYYRFGYSCFGIFLLGFSRWLLANLEAKGIERVYFFSRDGYIMKRAFDAINYGGVESRYLEVSRRSLRVPILWLNSSAEAIMNMISASRLISVKSIIDDLGLEHEQVAEVLDGLGLQENDQFRRDSMLDDSRFLELIERLRPVFVENSRCEFELLEQYAVENDLGGRFAVVDIGWSGGMQRYLSQALSEFGMMHQMSGYYTGITQHAARHVGLTEKALDLNGYVFDCRAGDEDARRFFVGFFESLFLEQAGSVSHYELSSSGAVEVVRYPYEYSDGEGLLPEADSIAHVQRGAMDFVCMVAADPFLSTLSISPGEAFSCIRDAGNNPTQELLQLFGDFRFFDEGVTERLAAPKKLREYAVHPRRLATDLIASRWKTGFAKRLFHGLPLPYKAILSLVAGKRGTA